MTSVQHRLGSYPVQGEGIVVAFCDCGWRCEVLSHGDSLQAFTEHLEDEGVDTDA